MNTDDVIRIINASENNLNSVTLDIPKNKFVVVTGVSGSGKSSLIFDVLYREAEFRYFGSFSAFARQFLGKMKRPEVERIEGLSPAVAVDQRSVINNPRSTVGTLSGIYDHLRLLFARTGRIDSTSAIVCKPDYRPGVPDKMPLAEFKINRSLFSFNSPDGACPQCKGLGIEDRIDPDLLIEDEAKSIRQRAMTITTPNGYIMYSQVTLDVLDQVCRAEGFSIDIPWKDLSPENKHVVLYGSNKIEIPFGKHPLESRMKWSGITAKPREMGVYKGIIPVMVEILRRERNKNILRFVRTASCSACGGKRLNPRALSVKVGEWDIAALSALPVSLMPDALNAIEFPARHRGTAIEIIHGIVSLVNVMKHLGLGHLSPDRESGSLPAGESRRLKLATQLGPGLSGMIYVFDEPSIGLHDSETLALISVLKQLRDQGNSVIVVEHDQEFIRHADHLIDIGPGPGIFGGNVLLNCAVPDLGSLPEEIVNKSKTLSYFFGRERLDSPVTARRGDGELSISGASHHNLKNIHVSFLLQAMNVVTGVSGAGKSSLVHQTLGSFLRKKLNGSNEEPGKHDSIGGWESIKRLTEIDQSPIGRTPRSNPATYTGLFDHIRDLFASLPESFERGYGKSRFSFNTQGGRCEDCQGAGYKQTGMRFMGNVEILCETCNGRRFDNKTLEVKWKGKNICEILEMPVAEAMSFFNGEKKILRYLQTMDELGLGYLTLGQRSSTLSGGEAQRVKLAAELTKPSASHTLYILDEPTTGLHNDDVKNLLSCLNGLADHGHTIICIEHHKALLRSADRIIKLGPGSGHDGGELIFMGTPEEYYRDEGREEIREKVRDNQDGVDKFEIQDSLINVRYSVPSHHFTISPFSQNQMLVLTSVSTHNLKSINVSIPHGRLTVITGISGSGKSSLAFDTIYAEARNRFLSNFSAYARSQIGMKDKPGFEEVSGLRPAFAVEQSGVQSNPRSTVGTYTGIYDLYRLLFSRAGVNLQEKPEKPLSTFFSFNSIQGACPNCGGLGMLILCDPEKLITNPGQSILNGAMDGSRTGKFYGDPYGQYTATLKAVGEKHGIGYSRSWNELSQEGKHLALHGCGEEMYDVSWEFLRNKRSGTHHFQGRWQGLLQLVNKEYTRKHADHRGESMMNVMSRMACSECHGSRLNAGALSWFISKKNIAEISDLSIAGSISFFSNHQNSNQQHGHRDLSRPLVPQQTRENSNGHIDPEISGTLIAEILRRLHTLDNLGLSYLTISRNTGSLSHGEARRLQLAAQTGSGLSGMIYILDEPTAGLHSKDTGRLAEHIKDLIQSGNTVVTVEHDREMILGADHIIDMGPGAGSMGGEIIAEGSPVEIMNSENSVTGKYLKTPPVPQRQQTRQLKPGLQIKNAFIHNLKHFDLEIPSGGIICVTGVSGSGKSSLVLDLIYASWRQGNAVGCNEINGFGNFSNLVTIDYREEFSSPLAVVSTYSGAFDLIRNLFAGTAEAERNSFGKNHFSFLNRQSQCPNCEGMGKTRISMDFMPDIYQECEVCLGKRYRPTILRADWEGKNIAEILESSVSESAVFFNGHKAIRSILNNLEQAGLGYLKLGQPLNTLSGGEAQRLNLAKELMKAAKDDTLYLFDEPSTGLHFSDIENLLKLFHGLAGQGNTLIIIEHDRQIIQEADFIIELGPEGGDKGGYLLKA
jgi:excinuclease ABC subunit A